YLIYFFFQAEDGIRDRNVTGVQTCALPISNGGTCGNDCASRSDITPLDANKLTRLSSWKRNSFTGLEELRRSSLFHRDDRSCIKIGRASCRERGEHAVGGVGGHSNEWWESE